MASDHILQGSKTLAIGLHFWLTNINMSTCITYHICRPTCTLPAARIQTFINPL